MKLSQMKSTTNEYKCPSEITTVVADAHGIRSEEGMWIYSNGENPNGNQSTWAMEANGLLFTRPDSGQRCKS